MNFQDIHGTDWIFRSPDGKENKVFIISGYKAGKGEKKEADDFEKNHPDWKKEIQNF